MQSMCFRPSVFLPSQRLRPCHNRTAWKAVKVLDLSAPKLEAIPWAAVHLKCFPVPNAAHSSSTLIFSTTEIASTTTSVSAVRNIAFWPCFTQPATWRNARVSASLWVHPLILFRSTSVDDETTLSLQVETSILRETWVLSISLERKQTRSLLFSSIIKKLFSRWKEMVPKVTPCDVDLGPVCLLSRPSSCLQDKRPKQFPTVEHSEVVQKCRSRRRCCWSPGKWLMSWGRAFEQQIHRQGSSHLLQVSGLQQGVQQCLCWSVVPLQAYKVQAQFH